MKCPVCEYPLSSTDNRTLKRHKTFFALMNLVYQHQDVYQSIDPMRKEIIMRTGRFVAHHHLSGSISYHAQSMSFAKMGENEFRQLCKDSVDVCLKHFCKNMDEESLLSVCGFFT